VFSRGDEMSFAKVDEGKAEALGVYPGKGVATERVPQLHPHGGTLTPRVHPAVIHMERLHFDI
jgi:hypothetical protein